MKKTNRNLNILIFGGIVGMVIYFTPEILGQFTTTLADDAIVMYENGHDMYGEEMIFEVEEVVDSPMVGRSLFVMDHDMAVVTEFKDWDMDIHPGDFLVIEISDMYVVLDSYIVTYNLIDYY